MTTSCSTFGILFGRFRGAVVGAVCVLVVGACGPSGPGALTGRLSADGLGGAILEVDGRGIQGFSGRGDSRVYSAPMPGREGVYRVVIIHPSGGEIGFDIAVDDVGMESPVVRVVSATRTDNSLMSPVGIVFTMER